MSEPSRIPRYTKSLIRGPRPLRRMPAMETRPRSTTQDKGMLISDFDQGFKNAPPAKTTPPNATGTEDRSASAFFQPRANSSKATKAGSVDTQWTKNDSVFDKARTKSTNAESPPTTPTTRKCSLSETDIQPGSSKEETREPHLAPPATIPSDLDERPVSLLENVSRPVSYRNSTAFSTHPALRSSSVYSAHGIHPALRDSAAPSTTTNEPFPAFRRSIVLEPDVLSRPQSQPLTQDALRRFSNFTFSEVGNPFAEEEEHHALSTISNNGDVSPFEDVEAFPSFRRSSLPDPDTVPKQATNDRPDPFDQPTICHSQEPPPNPDCVLNLSQKLISKLKRSLTKIRNLDQNLEQWTWNRDRKRLERRRLSQKRRESSARAKSIDEGHRLQIKQHRRKEKARNKRAAQHLRDSKKEMKVQSKNRDRAASLGSAAKRRWYDRFIRRRGKGHLLLGGAEMMGNGEESRDAELQRPVIRREGASLVSASVREVSGDDDESASSIYSVDEKCDEGEDASLIRTSVTQDARYLQAGGLL